MSTMPLKCFGSPRIGCRSTYVFASCALLCTGTSGCMRTVQVWPQPLNAGDQVAVRFSESRSIVFGTQAGHDSVAQVLELRGRVLAQHGDTLVVRVTRDANGTSAAEKSGRSAAVVLDSHTTVTRSEVDGWKVGYGILAGAVVIFAALVTSGS
jgi:hypothetical protein